MSPCRQCNHKMTCLSQTPSVRLLHIAVHGRQLLRRRTVAAAGWERRRVAALASVAIAAIAVSLIGFLGVWWKELSQLSLISPFHFYQGAAIIEGRANEMQDLSVLGAATVAAVALAYWQFSRRDL